MPAPKTPKTPRPKASKSSSTSEGSASHGNSHAPADHNTQGGGGSQSHNSHSSPNAARDHNSSPDISVPGSTADQPKDTSAQDQAVSEAQANNQAQEVQNQAQEAQNQAQEAQAAHDQAQVQAMRDAQAQSQAQAARGQDMHSPNRGKGDNTDPQEPSVEQVHNAQASKLESAHNDLPTTLPTKPQSDDKEATKSASQSKDGVSLKNKTVSAKQSNSAPGRLPPMPGGAGAETPFSGTPTGKKTVSPFSSSSAKVTAQGGTDVASVGVEDTMGYDSDASDEDIARAASDSKTTVSDASPGSSGGTQQGKHSSTPPSAPVGKTGKAGKAGKSTPARSQPKGTTNTGKNSAPRQASAPHTSRGPKKTHNAAASKKNTNPFGKKPSSPQPPLGGGLNYTPTKPPRMMKAAGGSGTRPPTQPPGSNSMPGSGGGKFPRPKKLKLGLALLGLFLIVSIVSALIPSAELPQDRAAEVVAASMCSPLEEQDINGGRGGRGVPPGEFSKPMKMPPAVLTSGFGPRDGEEHQGQDIADPGDSTGAKIYAFADGVVQFAGDANDPTGFGNWVVINHLDEDEPFTTVYGHMNHPAENIHVKPGEKVEAGQWIADVGNAGGSRGPHLHFEVMPGQSAWARGTQEDPAPWIEKAVNPGESSSRSNRDKDDDKNKEESKEEDKEKEDKEKEKEKKKKEKEKKKKKKKDEDKDKDKDKGDEDDEDNQGSTSNYTGDVYIIGDSITVGAKDEIQKRLPDATIEATGGWPLGDEQKELISQAKDKYDTIVILLGTNGPPGQVEKEFPDVVEDLKKADVRVIAMTIGGGGPDGDGSKAYEAFNGDGGYTKHVKSFNSMIDNISSRLSGIVDWNKEIADNQANVLAEDNLHPSGEGRAAFAELVEKAVKGLGPSKSSKKSRFSNNTDCCNPGSNGGRGSGSGSSDKYQDSENTAELSRVAQDNAKIIIAVGKKFGMDDRKIRLALTMAAGESAFRNLCSPALPETCTDIPHDGTAANGNKLTSQKIIGLYQQTFENGSGERWSYAPKEYENDRDRALEIAMNPAYQAGQVMDALDALDIEAGDWKDWQIINTIQATGESSAPTAWDDNEIAMADKMWDQFSHIDETHLDDDLDEMAQLGWDNHGYTGGPDCGIGRAGSNSYLYPVPNRPERSKCSGGGGGSSDGTAPSSSGKKRSSEGCVMSFGGMLANKKTTITDYDEDFARAIRQYAEEKVGSPYCADISKCSRTGPDTFDCSGFATAAYCYAGGIDLKFASTFVLVDMGEEVDAKSIDDLLPGDIILSGQHPRPPGHAKLYIGDGEIAESGGSCNGSAVCIRKYDLASDDVVSIRRFDTDKMKEEHPCNKEEE